MVNSRVQIWQATVWGKGFERQASAMVPLPLFWFFQGSARRSAQVLRAQAFWEPGSLGTLAGTAARRGRRARGCLRASLAARGLVRSAPPSPYFGARGGFRVLGQAFEFKGGPLHEGVSNVCALICARDGYPGLIKPLLCSLVCGDRSVFDGPANVASPERSPPRSLTSGRFKFKTRFAGA